jgi:hypothetical protein
MSSGKGSLNVTNYGAPGPAAMARTEGKRECQAPGCTTLLSAYNSGTLCHRHEQPGVVRAGTSPTR